MTIQQLLGQINKALVSGASLTDEVFLDKGEGWELRQLDVALIEVHQWEEDRTDQAETKKALVFMEETE